MLGTSLKLTTLRLGLLLALLVGVVRPADAGEEPLGDLVPEILDPVVQYHDVEEGDVLEGCAGGQFDRLLLRFALRTRNVGSGDIVLGDPGCPDCDDFPGAECESPYYRCSLAHGHAHFDGFLTADLLDSEGRQVAASRKFGFCLLDTECPRRRYNCFRQGITAGCADIYDIDTSCQYIDLTDIDFLAGGYTLRVVSDADNAIVEANDDNNTVEMSLDLSCEHLPDGIRCRDGDACTFGDTCRAGRCQSTKPEKPVRAVVHVRHAQGGGDDRVHLRARFGTVFLKAAPSVGGVKVTLRDPLGGPTQIFDVDPSAIRDRRGLGRVFRLRASAALGPEAERVERLVVRLRPSRGTARVNLRSAPLDLRYLRGGPAVDVDLSVGGGTAGCLEELSLPCTTQTNLQLCEGPLPSSSSSGF